MNNGYGEIKDSVRPFRIWDARAKKQCIGRNFKYSRNAHDRALLMLRWGKVGMQLEVFDIETGKLMGQYVRGLHAVSFTKIGATE